MDLKTLLNAVQSRTHSYGIGTAEPFLRQFESCLGGTCPAKYFESVTETRWRRAVKAAGRQLVYHHPEMGVAGEFETAASRAELPPHTIALFPAVITSTRQDRDGDILETEGAELDPKAPLLYQHMPFENIGRLLKQGERSSTRLTGEFSLCGTPLGEDCAMLAEHGALRISHGFTADEFEPLDDQEYEIPGFRVLKFQILEVSLVSIPSNPDAEITAFSRNKFKHPLTKAVAGAKYGERQVLSPVTVDVGALPAVAAAPSGDNAAEAAPAERRGRTCAGRGRCQACARQSSAEAIPEAPSKGDAVGKNASDLCDALVRQAVIEHARTGDLSALKALAEALSQVRQKITDTISRIERQSQWEAGDALITDAASKHLIWS
jgi:hypothetical protein